MKPTQPPSGPVRGGDDIAEKYESNLWFNPHRESKSEELDALVDDLYRLVDGYEFTVRGRKRARTETESVTLKRLVEAFVSDLVYWHELAPGVQLLVIRSNKVLCGTNRYKPKHYSKKFRLVLDALAYQPPKASRPLTWIEQTLGTPDQGFTKGATTMVRLTQRFKDEITDRNLTADDTRTSRGEEVIILRDANRAAKAGEYGGLVDYPDTDETDRIRAAVRTINDYIEAANIEVDAAELPRPVDPHARRMRRIFTCGSFETGGRLYDGFWQALPREVRARALYIQDEPTVTLDFAQIALRIAYSMVGADLPEGDGYTVPGLEGYREGVKKLIVSLLFPKQGWMQGISPKFRSKLPADMDDDTIVSLVEQYHAPLAPLWRTDVGHRIQKIESDIIVECLLKCIEKDIVALQVHDALIIPRSREAEVRQIMVDTFERHTGLPGEVALD